MTNTQSGAGSTGDRPEPLDDIEQVVPAGDCDTGDSADDADAESFAEELSAKDRNAALSAEVTAAAAAVDAARTSGLVRMVRRAERRLDDAKAALYQANIGLADKWAGRFRRDGDFQAAIEYRDAAREGLWEAIATWDPAKGGSLGTWAWPRIKKALFSEVVANEHAMSTHAFQYRPRVIAAVEKLRLEGAEITDEAVSLLAEVPVSMVARIRQADAAGSALRLDAPAGRDGDGSALADILVLEEPEHVEELYDLDDLRRLTAGTPLVEVWVGLRYHGADGAPPETLAGIGATLGRSREMARKAYNRFQVSLQRAAAGASQELADTAAPDAAQSDDGTGGDTGESTETHPVNQLDLFSI